MYSYGLSFQMREGSKQLLLLLDVRAVRSFLMDGTDVTCVSFQLKHIPPYGFLYYKQLQSLFRQCGQVKSIVFDGAK